MEIHSNFIQRRLTGGNSCERKLESANMGAPQSTIVIVGLMSLCLSMVYD